MQLVETKASKPTYQHLKERLVIEKLHHLSSVLRYRYGLEPVAMKVDDGKFELYSICLNCGKPHLLGSYSMDEVLSLTTESEAIRLMAELE